MSSLFDKTFTIELTFSRLGTSRKVPKHLVTVNTDKRLLTVAQKILDAPELLAIHRADEALKDWLGLVAIDSPMRSSTFLVPLPRLDEVETALKDYRDTTRPALIEAFLAVYDARHADAKTRRLDLYDASQYPSHALVRASFMFTWNYVDWSVPTKLFAASDVAAGDAQKRLEGELIEAVADIKAAMWGSLHDLVAHLADVLTPSPDGKKKRLFDTAITHLSAFLDNLPFKADVVGETDILKVAEQCRAILKGVDMGVLRDDAGMKSWVAEKMTQVKGSLDGMIAERTRRIVLD